MQAELSAPNRRIARFSADNLWVVSVRGRVLGALAGRQDLGLGLGATDPVGALDALAGLELLVDLEEVLDLQPVELRQVVDVAQMLQARVARRDGEHLVVTTLLV